MPATEMPADGLTKALPRLVGVTVTVPNVPQYGQCGQCLIEPASHRGGKTVSQGFVALTIATRPHRQLAASALSTLPYLSDRFLELCTVKARAGG